MHAIPRIPESRFQQFLLALFSMKTMGYHFFEKTYSQGFSQTKLANGKEPPSGFFPVRLMGLHIYEFQVDSIQLEFPAGMLQTVFLRSDGSGAEPHCCISRGIPTIFP